MAGQTTLESIHEIEPLEKGGVVARGGFVFQDHVAVGFFLDMFTNQDLKEVWCETQDDITLLWSHNNESDLVEFVQVKDHDKTWTPARLCNRDKSRVGTSVLEKSLANDRIREPCKFRMVTSAKINSDLKILEYPIDSPARSPDKVDTLCNKLRIRVEGFLSAKGHDCGFWLKKAYWQVEYDKDAIKRKNILKIHDFLNSQGIVLTNNMIQEKIYPRLLQLAQDAALAKWEIDPNAKKISQQYFKTIFEKIVSELDYEEEIDAGKRMQEKMEDANIPPDYIQNAHSERRSYRKELLTPKYLDFSQRSYVQNEVIAELSYLRSQYDAGKQKVDGIGFLNLCLEKLKELQSSLMLPLHLLTGCMYDITDRCGHRFKRESQ